MLGIDGALWNVFLMILPVVGVVLLEHKIGKNSWKKLSFGKQIVFLLGILLIILFLPNIAYVFTDARHVLDHCSGADRYKRCAEAPWSIPLFFVYATLAIPFFVIVIQKISELFARVFHKNWLFITPPILVLLSSLGVMLGLFERLNSWDMFIHPFGVLEITWRYFVVASELFILLPFFLCFLVLFYFFRFFIFGKWKKLF